MVSKLSNQRELLLGAYNEFGRSIVVVIDPSYYHSRGAKVRKWNWKLRAPRAMSKPAKNIPLQGAGSAVRARCAAEYLHNDETYTQAFKL